MGALLDHTAFVEHSDLIAELAGRQAVADINRRLVTGDVIELAVDFRFCNLSQTPFVNDLFFIFRCSAET